MASASGFAGIDYPYLVQLFIRNSVVNIRNVSILRFNTRMSDPQFPSRIIQKFQLWKKQTNNKILDQKIVHVQFLGKKKKIPWDAWRISGRTSRLSTKCSPSSFLISLPPFSSLLLRTHFHSCRKLPFLEKQINRAGAYLVSYQKSFNKVRSRTIRVPAKNLTHIRAHSSSQRFHFWLTFAPLTSIELATLRVINGVDQIDLRRELHKRKIRKNRAAREKTEGRNIRWIGIQPSRW